MGNIWTRIFRNKEVRILLLGLDGVGKTTLLYRLKFGEFTAVTPTIGFNVETIQYKDLGLRAWDIGSRDKVRPLFRHYYKGAEAVVFVIDGNDRERLYELQYDVLKPAMQSEDLAGACFLFLANKCDKESHMTNQEITERLGLKNIKHTWNIFQVSALQGIGLNEAMEWLICQLGAEETPKAIAASVPETISKADEPLHPVPSCTRAYSAIKCLFSRQSRQEKYHLKHSREHLHDD